MSLTRRNFLLGAGGLLAAPLVHAQQGDRVYRIGWILTTSPLAELTGPDPVHPITRAFVHELRALGYEEGRNLVLERRSAEGRAGRFVPIVTELVEKKIDVIVSAGGFEGEARKVTATVPIVIFAMRNPVESGLARSLARPGGNFTGMAVESGPENEAKRVQLLNEGIPYARRVAYLSTADNWEGAIGQAVRDAAGALGMELRYAEHVPTRLQESFEAVLRGRPDALFAGLTAQTYGQREQIVDFARRNRLPGIYPYLEMARLGGLLAYGVNVVDLGRRAAHYVDRIVRGARPADLPIDRPTKFDLVVNLSAARELGLTLPESLLLRADRTIG